MMTNANHNALYIGMTSYLAARVLAHKEKIVDGFTKKYSCTKFIYYEVTPDRDTALFREKELKKWSRKKKTTLILSMNPHWRDLSEDIGLLLAA